jgi:plasminogen activator inhibitor 1 RNA-binding protein
MSVASTNRFDLLGNDDADSDSPKAPVKTVDKTTMRSSKRDVEPQAPTRSGAPIQNRRGNLTGSEAG